MDAERDTDGTTDAHEGGHTPADGAGTEGEGGKPDTRPGDRLATIRRTLWWIGLALQLPFALTLIHFDTPLPDIGAYPMRYSAKTGKRPVINRRHSRT